MGNNLLSWIDGEPLIALMRAQGERNDETARAVARLLESTMAERRCRRLMFDLTAADFIEDEFSVMRGASIIAVSIPRPSRVALVALDGQRDAARVAESMFRHAGHAALTCDLAEEAIRFLRLPIGEESA